jgi:serine/threonine protein kinase
MSASSRKRRPEELRGQMAGEYRIGRALGSGGFGTVYEAEHPVLKRKAAVKVLHPDRNVDAAAVDRFFAEAKAASQIRHRNVVDIFSFGRLANGQHFYVMDLLDGAPLDRYLKERQRLDPGAVVAVMRPIAEALDALHAHAFVHRDVKPPNIFLAWESDDEVVPKLLDFGLVKLLADAQVHTASGVPMGTPHYMSPEQCRGEKVDARSDVYAFGVICFELLTGAPPYQGDTPAAVLVAHLMQEVPRVSEAGVNLPAELDAPLLRMLAKDPEARPSSAGAALRELDAALRAAGFSVPEGPPRLPRPSTPPEEAAPEQGSDFGAGGSAVAPSRTTAPLLWLVGFLVLGGGLWSLGSLLSGRPSAPVEAARSATVSAPLTTATPAPPPTSEPPRPVASATAPGPSAVASVGAPFPPATVPLTLHGVPDGTSVLLGDQELGSTPGPIQVPFGETSVDLKVVAHGYEPRFVRMTPSMAFSLTVTLDRPRANHRSRTPSDLENPF